LLQLHEILIPFIYLIYLFYIFKKIISNLFKKYFSESIDEKQKDWPLYCTLSLIEMFHKNIERKNTNFMNPKNATACKLRNVTSIRQETFVLRHLENLWIKRFVDDAHEGGKRSFDYFQPLRGPLLVHLTSALRG